MRKPKVQTERVGNQNCRVYHTNFKMSRRDVSKIFSSELFDPQPEDMEGESELTKTLAIGINGIEGVETFSITGYTLFVGKAHLFDWEEIEPQVVDLIRMIGRDMVDGKEIEHIKEVIWNPEEWGCNPDGTAIPHQPYHEDVFD